MLSYGLQTMDFLNRLQKFEAGLPPLVKELAAVMRQVIEEIERPQVEDILRLQARLREMIGDRARLLEACGSEGKFCQQCPFGAYLPSGFPYACEEKPLCLPWIVVVQPSPGAPDAPDA